MGAQCPILENMRVFSANMTVSLMMWGVSEKGFAYGPELLAGTSEAPWFALDALMSDEA
jgi:hypothetical protein